MVTMFDDSLLHTIGNLKMFLEGTLPITFSPLRKEERSRWIRSTLVRFKYLALSREEKGILRRYLVKVAGMSRAQMTKHIAAYRDKRPIDVPYVRHQPFQLYTRTDIELLAATDNAHGRLNGKAMQEICAEQYARGDVRFVRLAKISQAQVYRFRKHRRYREEALTIEKTKPT